MTDIKACTVFAYVKVAQAWKQQAAQRMNREWFVGVWHFVSNSDTGY